MNAYIEHANLSVGDLDEAVRFLQTAVPAFRIRGRGASNGEKWIHVGTDSSDVALYEDPGRTRVEPRKLNHLGFVVESVAGVRARLAEAGYREGPESAASPHRKRLYFFDGDGLEWEFVEYMSGDPAERNAY
jgi:catechol 2,3-dioxygenase-like lactoylglutathione lyase family enzyme